MKTERIHVCPAFKRMLKSKAAEQGKTLLNLTRDLCSEDNSDEIMLKIKGWKRKNDNRIFMQ